MKKPTVYLDTTIFSVFHHRSSDVITQSNRLKTRDWWAGERHHFDLFISRVVLQELRNGNYSWQQASVRMADSLPRLSTSNEARHLARSLIEWSVVPENKPGDALQMAITVVHEIDYLLTWNYAHLANPSAQYKLEMVLARLKLRPSIMVSPDTIPQVRFGDDPYRR